MLGYQNAGPFTSGPPQSQYTNTVPQNTQTRASQSGGRDLEETDYPMAGRDGSLTAPDDDFEEAMSSGRPVSGQPPLKKARRDDGKDALSNDRVLPSDGVDAFERARRFSD
ncbi:hypothetical protein CBER1_09008 [Cercospora berteroae]|uniref:Uncharacterized protein n=1 Tax=Cercospora berteroae TaxID=357750 RepID=A0A2S6CC63_9PEZI|nr:hypothetical protein CBER1_09008 [Cercospora berteroae]